MSSPEQQAPPDITYVVCSNPDCPEKDIPKDDSGYPHNEIVCGHCGDPVESA